MFLHGTVRLLVITVIFIASICRSPSYREAHRIGSILELDHVANEADSDLLAPLCASHHAVKSHGAETGPMAALRLRDPARRALVVQAAYRLGGAAILTMMAACDGAGSLTAGKTGSSRH
jgi:hypothetical protein